MPGAQLEEPAVEEERSEPVQVGCGAFLGTDDLEYVKVTGGISSAPLQVRFISWMR